MRLPCYDCRGDRSGNPRHTGRPAMKATAVDFPGPAPGKAEARADGDSLHLENAVLHVQWRITGGALRLVKIADKLAGTTVAPAQAECFQLLLAKTPLPGTRSYGRRIYGGRDAAYRGDRGRRQIAAVGRPSTGAGHRRRAGLGRRRLAVSWRAELRDGSNYVRQSVACEARREELELGEVVFGTLPSRGGGAGHRRRLAGRGRQLVLCRRTSHVRRAALLKGEGRDSRDLRCSHLVNGRLRPGRSRGNSARW